MKRKNQNIKIKKKDKGGSLIEALISIGIISFVIVSILSGFAQQQSDTRRNTDKNMAVMLAEMRMEELLKFPSTRLVEEAFVDYIVPAYNGFTVYGQGDEVPSEPQQFRRTATITKEDTLGQIATIRVVVDYGAVIDGSKVTYPYSIQFTTRRSLK